MDFYKNVLNVIYQDSLKVKNAYMNGIFNSDNVQDPKFVGKAAHAHSVCDLLGAVGQWCAQYEESSMPVPTSFLPELNPFIHNILDPEAAKQASEAALNDDEAHV